MRGADKRRAGGESGAVGEGQIEAYVGRQREAGLVESVANRSKTGGEGQTEAGLMKCGQQKLG